MNDDKAYSETFYLDNALLCCRSSGGVGAIFTKDLTMYFSTDEKTSNKKIMLYDDKQQCGQLYNDYRGKGLFSIPETEVLLEAIEADGEFTAVTEENTKEDILEAISYDDLPEGVFEYDDGMKFKLKYVV